MELYYEDDVQEFNSAHATQGDFCKLSESDALVERNKWIKSVDENGTRKSRKVFFSIFPHVDFFGNNKYSPPNMDLHLRYDILYRQYYYYYYHYNICD